MKKLGDLILVGIFLIFAGIIIIMAETVGVNRAKIIVPILFLLSGIYSIKHSMSNRASEIVSKFEMLKGIGLIVFAALVPFFSDDLMSFLMYVTYFILMYGLLEIMFPFSVLNSKHKIKKSMLLFRLVAGVITSIGAVILLLETYANEYNGLILAGVLTILIGLSNTFYAYKLKV